MQNDMHVSDQILTVFGTVDKRNQGLVVGKAANVVADDVLEAGRGSALHVRSSQLQVP